MPDCIEPKSEVAFRIAKPRERRVVFVETQVLADELRGRTDIVKLFYQQHHTYGCYSQNWRASKGEDHYDEACVVLNKRAARATYFWE